MIEVVSFWAAGTRCRKSSISTASMLVSKQTRRKDGKLSFLVGVPEYGRTKIVHTRLARPEIVCLDSDGICLTYHCWAKHKHERNYRQQWSNQNRIIGFEKASSCLIVPFSSFTKVLSPAWNR